MLGNPPAPLHALSVDVEDWYHDGGWTAAGPPAARVERCTDQLLALLAERSTRATLFFLSEVALHFPALVRRAVALGHEIGSHGHTHRRVDTLLRNEFRDDVTRSVRTIEDVAGVAVTGYRAPYLSIRADVRWPIDILRDLGLQYDSSICPIDRPPGLEVVSPRRPYRLPNGLWEVPVGLLSFFRLWNLPLASGGGLRILPQGIFRRSMDRHERRIGAMTFYLHPWELDPGSPTSSGPGRWLLRIGRASLPERLDSLLRERRFAPIRDAFPQVMADAEPPAPRAPDAGAAA